MKLLHFIMAVPGLAFPALADVPTGSAQARSQFAIGPCAVEIADPEVECGTLTSPENWEVPTTKKVKMPIVIFKAVGATKDKKPDPIVFLTGGPGTSPLGYLDLFAAFPMRTDRDIIIIEPRGYGNATPSLMCSDMKALSACFKQSKTDGIDPNQYNTNNSSRDLEALRLQLGVDRWNVFGASYGTFWALHYARLYGPHIRSLILDSPYPPQLTLSQIVTQANALNALTDVFTACETDLACNKAYPNLQNNLIQSVRRLDRKPVRLNGKSFDGRAAFEEIYGTLGDTSSLSMVPARITALGRSEYAAFERPEPSPRSPNDKSFDPDKQSALGLMLSVMCADDVPFYPRDTKQNLKAKWPADFLRLARVEGSDLKAMCRHWPVRRSDAIVNAPVKSDIASLILVGKFDSVTPPASAHLIAKTLPNSRVVVIPNAAHFVMIAPGTCVFDLMGAFLANPNTETDQRCAAKLGPPVWTEGELVK